MRFEQISLILRALAVLLVSAAAVWGQDSLVQAEVNGMPADSMLTPDLAVSVDSVVQEEFARIFSTAETELLFSDSEPDSILFSPEKRGFTVRSMVSAVRDSAGIVISNFTPAGFAKVVLLGVRGADTVNLHTFDSIPPFTRITVKTDNSLIPDTLRILCDDLRFKKLNEISVDWKASFQKTEGGSWGKVTTLDARKYCTVLANLGWMFSSDRFINGYLRDTSYILLNNRTNKAGDSVPPVIDRDQFYNRLIHHRNFSLGKIVCNVAGLGVWTSADDTAFVGAFQEHSLLGIKRFTFWHQKSAYAVRILVHEIGHTMGFSHAGTIAVDDTKDPRQTGFPFMAGNCWMELMLSGELPFSQDPF